MNSPNATIHDFTKFDERDGEKWSITDLLRCKEIRGRNSPERMTVKRGIVRKGERER